MNHSIYSADRTTHLKIVVVALVAGILVAGFSISARTTSDEGLTQTARVMKAGKPVADHQQHQFSRPLTTEEFTEFTRLFTSPPKSPRGYLEDPNYPQVDDLKTPAPHGRFLFVGYSESARPAQRRQCPAAPSRSACRRTRPDQSGLPLGEPPGGSTLTA